jgi:hypothetical protein
MSQMVWRRSHVLPSHLICLLHGLLKIRDLLRTERLRTTPAPFLLRSGLSAIRLLIYLFRDLGGIFLFCNTLCILTDHVLDIRTQRREAVTRIFPVIFPMLCRLLLFLALVIQERSLLTRGFLKAAVRTRGFHVSLGLTHRGRRLSTHIPSCVHLVLGVSPASGTSGWRSPRSLTAAEYLS